MRKHYLTNLLSLATLLLLLATAMPSFAQDAYLEIDSNGYYEINDSRDYETFRQLVATTNPYAKAKLLNDITVKNPIGGGDKRSRYRGTFDGRGHTITLEDTDNAEFNNAASCALFEFTEPGCVIRNLRVTGAIHSNLESVGSIVNEATLIRMENCISDVKIIGAAKNKGGLVGRCYGVCSIENCAYIGEIESGQMTCGIVGYKNEAIHIKSCYCAPAYNAANDTDKGYVLAPTNEFSTIHNEVSLNNYYCQERCQDEFQANGIPATEVPISVVNSGKLCYLLNQGGKRGVVWYQHGNFPYPFKGSGGQLITSVDNGETLVADAACNHQYAQSICTRCGAIESGKSVEPLQKRSLKDSGLYSIDNNIYSLDFETKTSTAFVSGLDDDNCMFIPETVNMDGQEFAVTAIDTDKTGASKPYGIINSYVYIPKSVMTIKDNAFAGSTIQNLYIADGYQYEDPLYIGHNNFFTDTEAYWAHRYDEIYIGRNLSWSHDIEKGPFFNTKTNILCFGPQVTRVGNSMLADPYGEGQNELFCGNTSSVVNVFLLGNENAALDKLEICCSDGMGSASFYYVNRLLTGNLDTNIQGVNYGGIFNKCNNVGFGPNVKAIDAYSFNGQNLTNLDLSMASGLETIENHAFNGCKALGDVDFSNTSLRTIYSDAFTNCRINTLNFGDKNAFIAERAFVGCNIQSKLRVPSTLRAVGKAAFAQSNIVELDYTIYKSGFFDEPVFDGATLGSVDLGKEYIEIYPQSFCGAKIVSPLAIPYTVTAIGEKAFAECQLDSIDMHDASITAIANSTFAGATMKNLVLNDVLETIGADAFRGAKIQSPMICPASLTSIGEGSFAGCDISMVDMRETDLSTIPDESFAGSSIRYVEFNDKITKIGTRAFYKDTNLKSISIPGSVTEIGNLAFADCENIAALAFLDSDTHLSLSDQFLNVKKLTSVHLGRNLSLSDQSALSPTSSTSWTIGPKVTHLQKIMFPHDLYPAMVFEYSKTPLRFDNYFNGTVKMLNIDRELVCNAENKSAIPMNPEKKNEINSLVIGDNITYIPTSMFEGCSGIKTLVIPANVMSVRDKAFKDCSSLEIVCVFSLPKASENTEAEPTVVVPSIGESAFENCGKLNYLYLMENDIHLADNAFKNCVNIKEITTSFEDDPGNGSSASAFDTETYASANLACANRYIDFASVPWKNFQKLGSSIVTEIYDGKDYQYPNRPYDRASLPHELSKGCFELVYLPFDMDSYYFGVDAEIYRVRNEEADRASEYDLIDNFISAEDEMSFDVSEISLEKINLDTEKTLAKKHAYLIKSNYDESRFVAYNNFFENPKINIVMSNAWLSKSGKALMSGGNREDMFDIYKRLFVPEDGVIKRYNGGDYKVSSLSEVVIRRLQTSVYEDPDKTPIAFNLMAGNTVLMSSKIDLPFNSLLDGYASFYAAGYNYIAPEWCDVYIVTSADSETVTLEKIEDRTITKGEAVLLKSNNEEKLADGLTEYLTYATNGSEYSYTGNLLKGVDVETPVSDLGREFVYVLSKTEGNGTGFYKYKKNLQAGKAYLDPESLSAQQLAKSCLFTLKDVANGVKVMQNAECGMQNEIYDLMGRRLKEAGFKGIYIVNGKKVVIK